MITQRRQRLQWNTKRAVFKKLQIEFRCGLLDFSETMRRWWRSSFFLSRKLLRNDRSVWFEVFSRFSAIVVIILVESSILSSKPHGTHTYQMIDVYWNECVGVDFWLIVCQMNKWSGKPSPMVSFHHLYTWWYRCAWKIFIISKLACIQPTQTRYAGLHVDFLITPTGMTTIAIFTTQRMRNTCTKLITASYYVHLQCSYWGKRQVIAENTANNWLINKITIKLEGIYWISIVALFSLFAKFESSKMFYLALTL